MQTYISLLRGINVSGKKLIKMADLKKLYEQMGLQEVQTYIQSGNVVFESKSKNEDELAVLISEAILKTFGFEVPVWVLNKIEFQKIYSNNPFLERENIDVKSLYIAMLDQEPNKENLKVLKDFDCAQDEFIAIDKCIYLHYPNGAGRTKMTNNLIEKKLKLKATSRNWRTMGKLCDLLG